MGSANPATIREVEMKRGRGINQYAFELGFANRETFLESLGKLGEYTILDLGSGEGEFMEQMRELGYNIIGVDIDPRSSDGIVQADFENLPFKDNQFDLILSSNAFMLYSTNPESLYNQLNSVKRIGKDGARVLTTVFPAGRKNLFCETDQEKLDAKDVFMYQPTEGRPVILIENFLDDPMQEPESDSVSILSQYGFSEVTRRPVQVEDVSSKHTMGIELTLNKEAEDQE
jgi:ubiquinone/menaquinone biosynthesis C-methylase UbiE